MKILNASNISPKVTNVANNIAVTRPITTAKAVSDSVSFGCNDDDCVCNNFGLLKDDGSYITNHFETQTKLNKNEEPVLAKFVWNANDKKVGFFGDELDFAAALKNKDIKTKDFDAVSNEKFSLISYQSEGIKYNLKYDKKTHELVAASAGILKDSPQDAIERIAIKKSNNNNGDYVFHYQFIDDNNSERAVEDTYVLFDKNMQAKASHTEKYFQYSDGEREEQKFACTYDEDGMPETADTKELSPYIW